MNPSSGGIIRSRSPVPREISSVDNEHLDATSNHSFHPVIQRSRSGSWGGANESEEDIAKKVSISVIVGGDSDENDEYENEDIGQLPTSVFRPDIRDFTSNQDITPPNSPIIDTDEEDLRKRLAFQFLNPYEKYLARKEIPWKWLLQIVKILLVTIQVIIFGHYRYAHTKYYTDNKVSLEHLFLKKWDAVREVHAYPPSTGTFAIYHKQEFYTYFDFIAQTYHNLEEISVNPMFKNSSFSFCIHKFSNGHVFPNLTWDIDFSRQNPSLKCLILPENSLPDMKSRDFLPQHNFDVPWDTMSWMTVNFTLKTLTYIPLGPLIGPECYTFGVEIKFDNSDYDGQIPIILKIDPQRLTCPEPSHIISFFSILIRILNYFIIITCSVSLLLCIRALIRAQILRKDSERIFKRLFNWDLSVSEKLEFLNGWYILICINDILIITGSIMKEMIEARVVFHDIWDLSSLFLGTGVLLVWIGLLRYLAFFETYNALILTMKAAIPKVLRFVLCASFIYFGFAFCGWLVLGPYHFKFKSIYSTSECLFSLINGDDMFATFSSLPEESILVYFFSRIYLYSFISLFIYVILSLFIAIIMDAYDIIKEHYRSGFPKKRIREFYTSTPYDLQAFRRPPQPPLAQRIYRTFSYLSTANLMQQYNNGLSDIDRRPLIT